MGNCKGDTPSHKIFDLDNRILEYGSRPITEAYVDGGYIKYQTILKDGKPSVGVHATDFMMRDFEGLFPDMDYVVLLDIFVEPDHRGKGIGTSLIKDMLESTGDKPVIVAVGASMKEYPEEPSDDDKIRITEELSGGCYSTWGFESINDYVGNYEFKCAMIYANDAFSDIPNRANSGQEVYQKLFEIYH